jgi:site-specific recombinase XerD
VWVFVLQKLLGHQNPNTTMWYLHVESRDIQDAMTQIG